MNRLLTLPASLWTPVALCVVLVGAAAIPSAARAQDAKQASDKTDETDETEGSSEAKVDVVGQQAAALEAELGKFKDTSPEAADTLVKLVNLYHEHGRAFGLIRAGHKFTSSHPGDPRHQAVMLQLIDGLEAMSRDRDLTVACRQFLQKHPKSPQSSDISLRLARTLDQLKERPDAAKVYAKLWGRAPNANGRDYGLQAVIRFAESSRREDIAAGAALAEQMLDRLPANGYSTSIGLRGFEQRNRISQWAEANVVGNKLLAKNLPSDRESRRRLLREMAENYARQNQYANAVESLKKARAIRDDQEAHYQQIQRMYNAAMKASQLKPVVDDYIKKHPDREDRFYCLGLLAISYNRDGDKAQARDIYSQVMMHQAATHSAANNFVTLAEVDQAGEADGANEAKYKAMEKKLLEAIRAPTQTQAYYARYALGFTLYRDRLKDTPRARNVLREMLLNNPPNDGNSWNALSYLLDTAPNDDEFRADVDRLAAAQIEYAHLSNYRLYLGNWVKGKKTALGRVKKNDPNYDDKMALKARVAYAETQLATAAKDPRLAAWKRLAGASGVANQGKARTAMMRPEFLKQQTADQVELLTRAHAHYLRHYAAAKQRQGCVPFYGQVAKRNPEDYAPAADYLRAATDYGPEELMADAAKHILKLSAPNNDPDIWRRLLIAASRNQDLELAKLAMSYIAASQKKYGDSVHYAASIGDELMKLELPSEASAYWKRAPSLDPNHNDAVQCASRIIAQMDQHAAQLNEKADDDEEKQKNLASARDEKIKFIAELARNVTDNHGAYASWLVKLHAEKGDFAMAERMLRAAKQRQDERPLRPWNPDIYSLSYALQFCRDSETLAEKDKLSFYRALGDLGVDWPSAQANLLLIESADLTPMERLLAYQRPTVNLYHDATRWDQIMPLAQAAYTRGQFAETATLVTGMLSHLTGAGDARQQAGRDMVARCYAKIGSVGLTIDETSPTAPLLQAALYLRLGDSRMAYDAYSAHRDLFDQHRDELPSDLVMFVCNQLIAAGGQENYDKVEEIVRGWLIKNSESAQIEDSLKAQFQLLLAKNYFSSQRYDVARSEFTTVLNRYPNLPEATEAEFGIGETFMAQKVFDQAEQVFEKLANSQDLEIVIRAEFLRGVLAFRRGDHDDARDIFRNVLERSPNIDLANQTLFNLSEVFGAEERYLDQLNLLRTVGRLGRSSKRQHRPGAPLSIVVHDTDLGISRGHSRIEVIVTTEPGGDREVVFLTSGGASKGLFRVDVDTQLGDADPGDGVLQLTGNDTVRCDYPDEFKKEFQRVPLSDVEIRISADAKFEIASAKIIEEEKESFAERLEREAREREEADQRMSQGRPENQVKPGNLVYLRVQDPDRDLTNEPDQVVVKLAADSGDQVQFALQETGSHTGVFEGQVATGELPAGALATDMAIDHSPLMAIDKDPGTYWMSEPDGAAPKELSIDLKDLKQVSRVVLHSPTPKETGAKDQGAAIGAQGATHSPVRGELLGSQDGEFWFRIASHPPVLDAAPAAPQYARMSQRVFPGNHTRFTTWDQVANLGMNGQPIESSEPDELLWFRDENAEDAENPFSVIWHGKIQQDQSGAARFLVRGMTTALAIDGQVQLPVGNGNRTVDVWLGKGEHELTIFAATRNPVTGLEAQWVRSDFSSTQVNVQPFQAADFQRNPRADNGGVNENQEGNESDDETARSLSLTADKAKLNAKSESFAIHPDANPAYLWHWESPEDTAAWSVDVAEPGVYEVWVDQAAPLAESRYQVKFGDQLINATVEDTRGWNNFRKVRVGGVAVTAAGTYELTITPLHIAGDGLMDLRGIELRPTQASVAVSDHQWQFHFDPLELRYVRFRVNEYVGEAVAINHVEISGDEQHIPTESDVLSLAQNDVLEIAGGDVVTASYTDEFTQSAQGASRLLSAQLTATYFNAGVDSIAYDFVRQGNGAVNTVPKRLLRIDPGERIVVQVTDYDEDRSAERDTIEIEIAINDGEPIRLTATETEEYSGVFTKEVDTLAVKVDAANEVSTEADVADGKLAVKPGDVIYCRYLDTQNTFPGHSVPRQTTVYVNQPTNGLVRILESRVTPRPEGQEGPAIVSFAVAESVDATDTDTDAGADNTDNTIADNEPTITGVAFEAPLTVEVIDPDAAKDSRSTVTVLLKTSDGASVEVECELSSAFAGARAPRSNRNQLSQNGRFRSNAAGLDRALEQGRFIGQVVLQLGGKDSSTMVPLTAEMPRNLIGGPKVEGEDDLVDNLTVHVLNVTGKDLIAAGYVDELRTDGEGKVLASRGRLIVNGELACTDQNYDKPIEQLHVGEKLYLRVTDADRDSTDQRDAIELTVATKSGEKEKVVLNETLGHSGVFTGSLTLKASEKPTPDNLDPEAPILETYFGDTLIVTYADPTASAKSADGAYESTTELPVVIGTNGLVSAFTKVFNDEGLAIETKFHIAESYFELFKSHRDLERKDEELTDLESGRRILNEVMEDYPDPRYAPRVAYLLGQFAQELGDWQEAIQSYDLIIRRYPDHSLAPDAQYKLAQCYEEAGDFDEALEGYVTLAATYPKNPLIASVMIRISDYFYKAENYDVASQVGSKFLEKFPGNQHAPKMAFRVGQCHYKGETYMEAGEAFDQFVKLFPDDQLAADALFWAGESYRQGRQNSFAFRRYNRCRWDFPASEAAKYARGRLALPEMLQQFEAEAANLEQ